MSMLAQEKRVRDLAAAADHARRNGEREAAEEIDHLRRQEQEILLEEAPKRHARRHRPS